MPALCSYSTSLPLPLPSPLPPLSLPSPSPSPPPLPSPPPASAVAEGSSGELEAHQPKKKKETSEDKEGSGRSSKVALSALVKRPVKGKACELNRVCMYVCVRVCVCGVWVQWIIKHSDYVQFWNQLMRIWSLVVVL